MRLTSTTRATDAAADQLVNTLASEAPGYDEGSESYRECVIECAREQVDQAITDFEPMPREEWQADGEASEAADRGRDRSIA